MLKRTQIQLTPLKHSKCSKQFKMYWNIGFLDIRMKNIINYMLRFGFHVYNCIQTGKMVQNAEDFIIIVPNLQ